MYSHDTSDTRIPTIRMTNVAIVMMNGSVPRLATWKKYVEYPKTIGAPAENGSNKWRKSAVYAIGLLTPD